ncbi:hypothetical protein HDA32_004300 [Spinactinospora alkalitolerans]|uniref:Uncharacterized protein n=1 Tax=Spinactinospora alkalitolerans TaxID=687207 RepID=A0A852U5J5_9ACTN|nr:hypothetical protein [Spinactinospora alkalitolerans]NYE49180.1 hypothetical protein [Spinactinospora alkalitolerans]
MRDAGWAAAVVLGGWLAVMVGYALSGAVAVALWPRPSDDPADPAEPSMVTDVVGAVLLLGIVAAVTWLGARLVTERTSLAPRSRAVVAAAGPLIGVAMTLALFLMGGGLLWAALAHAAAAALGAAAGGYIGTRG